MSRTERGADHRFRPSAWQAPFGAALLWEGLYAPTNRGINPLPQSSRRIARATLPLLTLAWAFFLSPAPARAHPIHTSYAEADYRPATGTLEIAIRLFADDAAAALTQHAGKPISLATTPVRELDAMLLTYVRARFTVTPREAAAAAPLAWMGREVREQGQHLWLYLQCPLPGGPAGARVRHGLLRETFSDQINSVRVRDHAREPAAQVTLLFLKDGEQTVAFAK